MGERDRRADILFRLVLVAGLTGTAAARFPPAREVQFAPRGRIACLSSSTPGVRYPDPCALGDHSYGFGLFERNGIVYTARGGHVDITHLRKAADWTAHLAYQARETIRAGRTEFSFRMREPTKYHVRIEYPAVWASLPADTKEGAAGEVAIGLGQYLAFTGCTWHEILTWFGFKGAGFYTEYESAFAWEDCYSNALGCQIGGWALRDPDRTYNEAMTLLTDRELRELGVRPRPAAHDAAEAVRNLWFSSGYIKCHMLKRNFDIGADDGAVTPWLAPGYGESDGAAPEPRPVPRLALLDGYGFAIRLEIEPREWESDRILRIVHPDGGKVGNHIEPAVHFGPIMEYIRAQAVARYGPQVEDRYARSQPAAPRRTVERARLRQASAISGLEP